MRLGKVIDSVWATKKVESMNGFKLMVVDLIKVTGDLTGEELVAVDTISAGIGDTVIVTTGSAARILTGSRLESPIDAAIIGIVDEL